MRDSKKWFFYFTNPPLIGKQIGAEPIFFAKNMINEFDGFQLPYSLALQVSNPEALVHPGLNISSTGLVPTVPSTFTVELPCSGRQDAEIDVRFHVNITMHRANHNVTHLTFRRKKICLRGTWLFDWFGWKVQFYGFLGIWITGVLRCLDVWIFLKKFWTLLKTQLRFK